MNLPHDKVTKMISDYEAQIKILEGQAQQDNPSKSLSSQDDEDGQDYAYASMIKLAQNNM